MSRSEDDVLGALAVEKRFYRTAVQQIQLGMGAAYEVFVPLGAEVVPMAEPTSPRWPAT